MTTRLLIANRGEIALRIARAALDRGLAPVGLVTAEEQGAAHTRLCADTLRLPGEGPGAYLDGAMLVRLARESGCALIHPGYGFLSESADFARACAAAGLTFIGPKPDQLALFGDKAQARALANACDVPLMPGTGGAVSLDEARAFFAAQGGAPVMIKALAGGGGRGMRRVARAEDLDEAYARCRSEAKAAFGQDEVYVERFAARARHIEVQVVGDGSDVMTLGERDCTVQRRFQKMVEIAPAPGLRADIRAALAEAALRMARACSYTNLGTFEFLVDESLSGQPFVFLEANPRLQVEHTVTEAVTGLDLVQIQIALAQGETLASLGLDPAAPPVSRGVAIQWRINAERLEADGTARPATGTLSRFALPSGPGLRIDSAADAGQTLSPRFDTLLAKLVVHGADFDEALRRSRRAMGESVITGAPTSLPLLRALADREDFVPEMLHTRFVEEHLAELLAEAARYAPAEAVPERATEEGVLAAPLTGRLVEHLAAEGEAVAEGAPLAVIEAMKMEHVLRAPYACRVIRWRKQPGDGVDEGAGIAELARLAGDAGTAHSAGEAEDPTRIRADLQKALDRHAFTQDEARPDAVAKRHAQGLRMARENIADLCDPGSFSEYGALAFAAQRTRRKLDDLIANTPADGLVTGIGSVNGALFGEEKARTAVMAYDATVLAGTQGFRNHQKTDRLLAVADSNRLPFVLFAEGGGGRPGDTDMPVVAGLHLTTFGHLARLSGLVPLIGIAAGRCFAGNAALLGCCDVIIATQGSNIGMGGPAMIEGGGLGRFRPEEVGPSDVQSRNGVIDVLVDDEAQAVSAAKRYLSYFQGPLGVADCADQRLLRAVVPENRLRVYDIRAAIDLLFDTGSVLELRAGFGAGMVTALARLGGRPVGVIANNPMHLGGAIDAPAADKGARFLSLCNAHGLPVISLIDTPGFMVGPKIEEEAQVRHVSRLFVTAAALRVPFLAVVLRKGYGLGAMGMAAGGFHAPDAIVSWPSGEFGGMGLEGAVRLGYRKELEAAASEADREALFRTLVAKQYEAGGALNMAAMLEIDAVIDPADTRAHLLRGLASAKVRSEHKPFIDTW